ncbi:MAG: hypothetical protein LBT00_02515, partial [Spirochaetaceae bacterium]|nr:hypothetical protein [Spirochaetaceae bacterium]
EGLAAMTGRHEQVRGSIVIARRVVVSSLRAAKRRSNPDGHNALDCFGLHPRNDAHSFSIFNSPLSIRATRVGISCAKKLGKNFHCGLAGPCYH